MCLYMFIDQNNLDFHILGARSLRSKIIDLTGGENGN
jgi:hypothetical protein